MELLSLFLFGHASIVSVLSRLGIHIALALVVIFLVSFFFVVFTKNKRNKEVGIANWIRYAVMWGIIAAIAICSIIVILTLRANPAFYFTTFEFSLYCGYILMLPEFIVIVTLISVFYVLKRNIKNSLK